MGDRWFWALSLAWLSVSAQALPLPADCPPQEIRYSLLVSERDAANAPLTQDWRRASISEAQAATLPLYGDVESSMREYLAARGVRKPALLTRCFAPPRALDVAAYMRTVEDVVEAMSATRALAVGDGETGEWLRPIDFKQRRVEGRADGVRVSPTNPPVMGIMASAFTVEEDPRWGTRSRGLRKLGLPDLSLGPAHPGHSLIALMQMLGDLALAGRLPLETSVSWELPVTEPAVRRHLRKGQLAAPRMVLRWQPEPQAPSRLLRLEMADEPATLHPFEQQALMVAALWGSPYAALGPERARALGLAVARSKIRVRELIAQLPQLQAQGARLWLVQRIDTDAAALALGTWSGEVVWEELRSANPGEAYPLRRWTGDPRKGGQVHRVPPKVIGGQRFEFEDSSFSESTIDDWLLQDGKGQFTAGEPLALLRAWNAEGKPSTVHSSSDRPRAP